MNAHRSATLQDASELDLLSTYESILGELARRGVIRTNDSPVGQYAEWLAARVLDGALEANSVKSHDLICEEFGRVQVKSRVIRGNAKRAETQLSPFRSFEFDDALILLFDVRLRRGVGDDRGGGPHPLCWAPEFARQRLDCSGYSCVAVEQPRRQCSIPLDNVTVPSRDGPSPPV